MPRVSRPPARSLTLLRAAAAGPARHRAARSCPATTGSRACATPTRRRRWPRRSTTGRSTQWLEPRAAAARGDRRCQASSRRWRCARSSASAAHPGFVAVYLPVRSAVPYGNRQWWPLCEAAVTHELVVELHFGGSPGLPPTASGWPTSWLEDYVDMASAFQSQLTSLVRRGRSIASPTCGVADRVRFRLAAGVPVALRQGLARASPRGAVDAAARRRSTSASTYACALQPVDGPPEPSELLRVIDQLGSEELLMFSSDYPHRHSAEGVAAVPEGLPAALHREAARRQRRATITG